MKKILLLACMLLVAPWALAGGDREDDVERLEDAAIVLNEMMAAPDSAVPAEIMQSAKCIAVIPSMLKGGFIVGASYGKGVATCRVEEGWSAPAFFKLEGGSFGFQIGGQAVDLVMVITNEAGMRALLSSKFKLGADASVAAGPVGRHAEGMTDWKMRAHVLTYSRARGAFAGIAVNGAYVRQHDNDTRDYYGKIVSFRAILSGKVTAPEDAQPFLASVRRHADAPPAPAPAPPETKPAATAPAAEPENAKPAKPSPQQPPQETGSSGN